MTDLRRSILKFKTYRFDRDLTKAFMAYKIDGVQAIRQNGQWVSRAGKDLHNLPHMPDGIYEVYLGDWESSVSAVRTHKGKEISKEALYQLYPILDMRLFGGYPDGIILRPKEVKGLLDSAVRKGYEGLVIRSSEGLFKVKPVETHDVEVLEMIEGKGKNLGKAGALVTPMGKVGTGLTDAQRDQYFKNPPIGKIIEVEAMSLTPNGKFRHPRFVRERVDK